MISAGKVSSPLSVAELRKKGEAAAAQASEPATAGDYTTDKFKSSKRPLSEYVRFETKEGMALLFHPGPLDRWIGKYYRWDGTNQNYVDPTTGGILTSEESQDYRSYLQRHKERRQMGDRADKVVKRVKLVGRCNPAVEEELRVYIGRFPGEIRGLLASGKKIYKQILANRGTGGQWKPGLPSCARVEARPTKPRSYTKARSKRRRRRRRRRRKTKSKGSQQKTTMRGTRTTARNLGT